MERKSITVEGKLISYYTAGEGTPVMLLHGFGADSSIWKEQINFLSKDYLVIAPDLPGISLSEPITDMSMESIALIAKLIMEDRELENIVLIGHSMGGYATLAFAEQYPQLLRGFGLFHSVANADNEEKKNNRTKSIEFVKQHGATTFLETTAPKMFGTTTKSKNLNLYDKFMKSLPEMSNESVINYYEAMIQRPDRIDILKNAKVPVLFIYGKEDEIIDIDKSIEQSSLPTISSVYILKKAGHLGMIEEPEEANKALKDFLYDL